MEKRAIDWESIERDYRAGILSLREIAAAHGVSHVAVNKRAKRDGWDRDLSARIQAKAEALVNREAVTALVTNEARVTEREIIESNATRIAQVRGEHRRDITQYRGLAAKLKAELEHQTDNGDLYAQLFELLSDPEAEEEDANAAARERQRKRREVFERAMSLGGRVKTMKDLADVLKTLVALDREAYGLEKGAEPGADKPAQVDPVEGARRLAFALARANAVLPVSTVH